MTIQTRSKFYYGHIVTRQNRSIPLNEGSGEINVNLRVGSYSLTGYMTEVARALNSEATLDYTVSVDRDTRFITIDASATMELLFGTGLTIGTSAAGLLGFPAADTGSAVQHIGTLASGSVFTPQFKLQDFVDFNNNVLSSQASVNESANGRNVEVVTFGKVGFMECNMLFQTDIQQASSGGPIENDPSGVANLRDFLAKATLKGNMEFMPDRSDSNTFTKVILESTAKSKKGIDYRLDEQKSIPGYFKSGKLTFREIT